MRQPLFDFDLKHVSREHYITGKAAINFPRVWSTTGGWHFLSYFDREAGVAKVSLAGIHYPDTTGFFGDAGVIDVTEQLAKRGWFAKGRPLFMADHYRAAADMVVPGRHGVTMMRGNLNAMLVSQGALLCSKACRISMPGNGMPYIASAFFCFV